MDDYILTNTQVLSKRMNPKQGLVYMNNIRSTHML